MGLVDAQIPLQSPPSVHSRGVLWMLALVALTVAVYIPALRSGFIWDDPDYVLNNMTLRSLRGLWDIWTSPRSLPQWYPLVHTTFWLEYRLVGLHPFLYHLTNVLLHAGSAVVLWRVLVRLNVPGAFFAAAIFAVHPVNAESVAWITERKNTLSLFLALASMSVYLKFIRADEGLWKPSDHWNTDRPARALYAFALVLFAGALLSKTVVCTLPAAMLVIVWWKRGRVGREDVMPLVPMFVLGILLAVVTAMLERFHVGASPDIVPELQLSAVDRLLIASRVPWFYAASVVYPVNLQFIYPRWKIDPSSATQWLFPLATVGGLIALVLLTRARKLPRGVLAAVLIFGGVLVPAMGFVNIYPMRFSFVADHFQYHASAALIALIASGIFQWVRRMHGVPASAAFVVYAVVIATLGLLTVHEGRKYKDAVTLWSITAEQNPDSWMVWTNWGNALAELGRFDEAGPKHERALELAPHLHDTHWNVGVWLMRQNRVDEAEARFREAMRINDRFAPALDSLAQLYFFRRNDPETAAQYWRRALQIAPTWSEANHRYAVLLIAQSEREGVNDIERIELQRAALNHLRTAVANKDGYADALEALGTLCLRMGRADEASANLLKLTQLRPDYAQAHNKLGFALLGLRQNALAAQSFERALALDPELEQARRGLNQARGTP